MAPKTSLEARPEGAVESVVEGRADLGFNLISEILPVAGAELVGPLPAELQSYVVFTSGIGATSKDQAAAKAFIDFLTGPTAVPVLKAKGMELRSSHRGCPLGGRIGRRDELRCDL